MGKLTSDERLKICSMRKQFEITAIFNSIDDANAYMTKTTDEGVIAEIQGIIFIASLYGAKSEEESGQFGVGA